MTSTSGNGPRTLRVAALLAERELDALVVDMENDFVNLGVGRELAKALGADHLEWRDGGDGLDELDEIHENIVGWIRGR